MLQIADKALQRAVPIGIGQLEHEFCDREEPDCIALLARADPQRDRHVGFAGPNPAVEDEVLLLLDELAAKKLFPVEGRGESGYPRNRSSRSF